MPSIAAGNGSPPLDAAAAELKRTKSVKVQKSREIGSTPGKRRLRSNSAAEDDGGPIASTPPPKTCSPTKWKSPRRCISGSPNSPASGIAKGSSDKLGKLGESLVKKLSEAFIEKPEWNPRDVEQLSAVKDTLHVSKAPCTLVCREDEQERVLQFCKQSIEQEKAGSLYVCGCPGTGKSLSMERVKESLIKWVKEAGFQQPDVLTVNCTSLTYSSEIFCKILGKNQPRKKTTSPLQNLQHLYSQKQQSAGMKMMLIIADELDYLITKDRAVLHDLFMLTTFPSSRCILIGIANAIDLADRFLPRLQSLNCKPLVVTFRAYSKDQIMLILQQRLKAFPFKVFQPQALELCARKVAAACGDMRKALSVCRSAIEMLEAELRESACILDLPSADIGFLDQRSPACDLMKQNISIVRVDHMAIALSKTYRSPTVDTIQALPQHQQIILCSAVKLFCGGKKDATVGELCKSYLDICKLILIPPVGNTELSSMCRVLADQGLLKLGQSREDKLRRVTLNVDDRDIAFALEGIRVFRNCLNAGNKNMDL